MCKFYAFLFQCLLTYSKTQVKEIYFNSAYVCLSVIKTLTNTHRREERLDCKTDPYSSRHSNEKEAPGACLGDTRDPY